MIELWWSPVLELDPIRSRLSEAEQTRLADFSAPQAAAQFATARYVLRNLLARHCGCEPEISIQPGGKPMAEGLEFNLSHAGDWVLVGLSDSPLGVDVERVRKRNLRAVAERYYTADEMELLRRNEWSTKLFTRIWSCKEALVKATGEGVRRPMNEIDVCAALKGWCPFEGWNILSFGAPEGHVAALASQVPQSMDVYRYVDE